MTLIFAIFSSDVFAIGGPGDTTWTHFKHIRNAAITYSASTVNVAGFVARKYDLDINPTGAFLTAIDNEGTNIKRLRYTGLSSYSSVDPPLLTAFCTDRGYDYDSMFMWVNADSTVELSGIAAAGSPCTDGTVITTGGNPLEYCGWASYRKTPDFRRTEVWEYCIYKYFDKMGTVYDGIMEDEATFYYHPVWDYYQSMMCFPFKPNVWVRGSPSAITGWEGYTHDEIRDSLQYLKQYGWLPKLMDTLYAMDKLRFSNPAAYGVKNSDVIDDCIITGTGVLLGEGMALRPLYTNFHNAAWEVMDTIATSDSGYATVWVAIRSIDSVALGSWSRCMQERLTWYYMAADYSHFYFMVTGLESWLRPNDWGSVTDSLYKWSPLFEYDVGQPDSTRYIFASGTDGAGQSYTLYRRDYTRSDGKDVIMLYRRAQGSNYGSSSGVTVDLGGDFRQLQEHKEPGVTTYTYLDSVVNTATIRNCEGMIFIADEATPPDSIPPADIDDLGLMEAYPGDNHGEIVLRWYASGDDGTEGNAHHYQIRYSRNPIDESNWSLVQLVQNPPAPAPPGTQETFVLSCPLEGETYYVAIRAYDEKYNPSPGISSFPVSYSAGIKVPQTITTVTDPDNGSVTVTCRTVDSYMPISYEFALDTNLQLTGVAHQTPGQYYSDTSAGYFDLSPDLQYFWSCRAIAADQSDSSDWSNPRGFTLMDGETIPVLALSDMISPAEGDILLDDRPVFSVNYVSNLVNVFFQIDEDPGFVSPIESGAVAVTPGDITTWRPESSLDLGLYYWSVSADNNSWTPPVSFVIASPDMALEDIELVPHPYPNPFSLSETSHAYFTNLPAGSIIHLMTVSGNTVKELRSETGESVEWDGTNESGNLVSSGVYLWFLEGTDHNGKLIVIR